MPHLWSRRILGSPLVSEPVVLCLLMSAALAQPPDTPFLRIEAGMHTAPIRHLDVDAQARFPVTASNDKTAPLWSLASGELLKVLRPPIGSGNEGRLYAVAISPDGKTVATAGWTKAGTDFHNIYLRWLGSIQAQKSLVLLDTCASGTFVTALSGTVIQLAAARDLSDKGAIDRLMRATGRAVIAASTELQFALEGHSGHGVFTYALLQGLRGEADAQGDRDGAITVDELSAYVAKEVPRITQQKWGYEQFPMRQVGGLPFPIGLVPR